MASGPKKPASARPTQSLRDEVQQALLAVLRDKEAPAMARASAARTLAQHFADAPKAGDVDLDQADEAELDRLIAANGPAKPEA